MATGTIREALNLLVNENLKNHRTYRIWYAMRSRCLYTKHHAFHKYGGRGITFDQRWGDFLLFLEDMGHPPTNLHTIERINNDGNYCKDNCKWATKLDQNKNKSNLYKIQTVDGIANLSEACIIARFPYQTIHKRIHKYGWTLDKALSTPIRRYNHA